MNGPLKMSPDLEKEMRKMYRKYKSGDEEYKYIDEFFYNPDMIRSMIDMMKI